MKILYVTTDGDYGATNFETTGLSYEQTYEKALANGGLLMEEYEGENYIFRAYEFGDVDPKFIDFVRNEIQDYDDSKHKNFYVLPEDN